jgi:hypothetical protein
MPELTFLPWLELRQEAAFIGVSLIPWHQFRESSSLSEAERNWLDRYFNCYRRCNGTTPVETVTILRLGEGGLASAYRTIRAAAAACLVYEHAQAVARGNPTMLPPRGERWLIFGQRFKPEEQFVALTEGYTVNVWPLDSFVEVEPRSPGASVWRLDAPIVAMAEALVRQGEREDELGAALDLLVEGAMTSNRHLARLNFVFLGAALELLAHAGGKRRKGMSIAVALAAAVRRARDGCPTAENSLYRQISAARRTNPDLVQVWMAGCEQCGNQPCERHRQHPYRGFYWRRNKVAHEARTDVTAHQRPDSGEPHSWPMLGGGAHACDVALAMSGWLLLDRVAGSLSYDHWTRWCHTLDSVAEPGGMAGR